MISSRRRPSQIAALRTFMEAGGGPALPLPPKLSRLYGSFRLPKPRAGFHVFSNFVSTLDGVVSLQVEGHSGGGDISGVRAPDRMDAGPLAAGARARIRG